MRIWHNTLLGVAATALIASTAAAQEHARWNDDGTVDLMLGPDYDNAVITAAQEDLGTLFGPDEKPFEGVDITVLTLDSGPKGGISGPINAFRPVWEELSGGKLDIALVPITDLFAKMMLDLRQGTGLYDAIIVGAFFYGDLIAGDYMVSVRANGSGASDHANFRVTVRTSTLWGVAGLGVIGASALMLGFAVTRYGRR